MSDILVDSIKDDEISMDVVDDSEVLEVVQYPNPILRKKSLPVSKIDSEIKKLAHRMLKTMYTTNGVGLAAPQIAQNLNMFVIDTTKERNPIVFINPEIIWVSDEKELKFEGCLSVLLGDEFGEASRASAKEKKYGVERSLEVKIRYQDLSGKSNEIHAGALLAHCIQHENDHLYGVLYIDKVKIEDSALKEIFERQKAEKEAGEILQTTVPQRPVKKDITEKETGEG